MDAVGIAAAVRAGQRSARSVVDDHLARIAATDTALGAFQVVLADQARRDADALAGRTDLDTLALAGVPVAVKDNIAVAGVPTRHGSGATSAAPAVADDELVRRLRAAGAIVVGTTRLPELAIWGFTESRAFGGTRNPRDPSRNAGGSTGGGAAAVAGGLVPLALGSDGGGSLRIPAANCGVIGFKPSHTVVPLAGGRTEHWYGCSAYGPIASTVTDVALALDVLAGTQTWRDPAPPDSPLRIAVSLRSPSPLGRLAQADPVGQAALRLAADLARAAGHAVRDTGPPYPGSVATAWVRHWHAGVAADVEELDLALDRLEPLTRAIATRGQRLHRRGLPTPAEAPAFRQRMLDWFDREGVDVLLTPTIARPAPPFGAASGFSYLRAYLNGARTTPYTQAWNLAALPAMSLPLGGAADRPGAVQIIARSEETVLRFAVQLEAAAGR